MILLRVKRLIFVYHAVLVVLAAVVIVILLQTILPPPRRLTLPPHSLRKVESLTSALVLYIFLTKKVQVPSCKKNRCQN